MNDGVRNRSERERGVTCTTSVQLNAQAGNHGIHADIDQLACRQHMVNEFASANAIWCAYARGHQHIAKCEINYISS